MGNYRSRMIAENPVSFGTTAIRLRGGPETASVRHRSGSSGIQRGAMSFTTKIIVSMVAGILVGVFFSNFGAALEPATGLIVGGLLDAVGRIFIVLLQMMVVPLVLVSLVCGVTGLGDFRVLGRVGAKTLALYLLTTAIALTLALSVASLIGPGEGSALSTDIEFSAVEAPPLRDVLVNVFPRNPIRALAEGEMLQVIFFALFFGFALTHAGKAGKRIAAIFDDLNHIVTQMVLFVIRTAPVGVFALIATAFAEQGLDLLRPLADYMLTLIAVLVLHVLVTYTSLVRLARLSVRAFLVQIRAVMTFAFSTSSSAATIPVTLNTLERRMGVDNSIASFTVPLGATINMDGTAIMQGVATVFIANVYGIDLGFSDYIVVILTATLASIGTAAVPSAGTIMLTMVLTQVGLPAEGVGLILAVDRLLDMLRTAVNVCGDSAVTCFVARTENAIDVDVFNDLDVTIESSALDEERGQGAIAGGDNGMSDR
jgi:DAACS family dicarboxylate/amino acid:cation (Na+ or H+) symporter